jgi:hypothetical protein
MCGDEGMPSGGGPTTLNLDDALLERAHELTGIQEKTALLHAGTQSWGSPEAHAGTGCGSDLFG